MRVAAASGLPGVVETIGVATGEHDPLQVCVAAAIGTLVHDPLLMRRFGHIAYGSVLALRRD